MILKYTMLYGDQGKCSTSNFSVDDLQLRGVGDFKLSLKYADEYLAPPGGKGLVYETNVSPTFGFILYRFTDKDCLHVDNSKVYLNGSPKLNGHGRGYCSVSRMTLLGVYSGMFVYAEVWKH